MKVGDRVITNAKCMGGMTNYVGVLGTVARIRTNSELSIVFTPDVNIPEEGENLEWSLYEWELDLVPEPVDWEAKYKELKALVDTYNAGMNAGLEIRRLGGW